MAYGIIGRQKNKRKASEYLLFVVGRAQCGMLGDKEIAVKIRGNGHYRNSA
jgi:hypothetical protein